MLHTGPLKSNQSPPLHISCSCGEISHLVRFMLKIVKCIVWGEGWTDTHPISLLIWGVNATFSMDKDCWNVRPLHPTPLEGAALACRRRSRATSEAEEEQQEAEAGPHASSIHIKIMASSKSKGARKNDSQDTNLETTEEDKSELCPGFKDVDAFVKVSKTNAEVAARTKLAAAAAAVQGATWIRLLRLRTGVQWCF